MISLRCFLRCLSTAVLTQYVTPPSFAEAGEPFLPLAPQELLALLPKPPTGWTLKVSRAQNEFSTRLKGTAKREFEGPVNYDENNQPLPLQVFRLKLTDSGGWTEKIGASPDARGKGLNITTVNGFPALRGATDSTQYAVVCINERFLLTAQLSRGSEKELNQLLDLVDFKRISGVPAGTEISVPNPVQIILLDEVAPKKSRSTRLYWTPPETAAEETGAVVAAPEN